MDKISLGDRMKNNYENISRYYLTRRMPVIIRIDMKSGHTFTKGMEKPFDTIFVKSMQDTMKCLCEKIQGCVLGYTQSDEISLLLIDYENINTDAWFGNNLQKMCSVSASIATMAFNNAYDRNFSEWWDAHTEELVKGSPQIDELYDMYWAKSGTALFDSRVFTIPKEEVCNYFIWRQQDAIRNSIQSVGQANFSPKELHKKSCKDIQDMLIEQKGINWEEYSTTLKRGSCYFKFDDFDYDLDEHGNACNFEDCSFWLLDENIPVFSEDRTYVEQLV